MQLNTIKYDVRQISSLNEIVNLILESNRLLVSVHYPNLASKAFLKTMSVSVYVFAVY